ncbi:hypothetical protein [Amycolatopsis alkalitolerans]|uniref:Uncharacterized protein n=1 Tax=Amycolatopsis alkalitolerans TaxID=2547244 RepID=A0A5C4LY70_9PSEU|nr:hypothetical protein [Amycolatopsis alkalitolerans]TNC22925.1 hypothetical protein FG385_23840 [Amycolatopsis alkalitolerans]
MTKSSPQDRARPGWFAGLAERFDDWLFAREDAKARARGWQVSRRKGGRAYRDPRWDAIRRCEFCDGAGRTCAACQGVGVIRDVPEETRQVPVYVPEVTR